VEGGAESEPVYSAGDKAVYIPGRISGWLPVSSVDGERSERDRDRSRRSWAEEVPGTVSGAVRTIE
jgi:hypothetical protein